MPQFENALAFINCAAMVECSSLIEHAFVTVVCDGGIPQFYKL